MNRHPGIPLTPEAVRQIRASFAAVPVEAIEQMRTSFTAVPVETIEQMRASFREVPATAIKELEASFAAVPVEAIEQMGTSFAAVPIETIEQMRTSIAAVPEEAIEQMRASFREVPAETIHQMTTSITALSPDVFDQVVGSIRSLPLHAMEGLIEPLGVPENGALTVAIAIAGEASDTSEPLAERGYPGEIVGRVRTLTPVQREELTTNALWVVVYLVAFIVTVGEHKDGLSVAAALTLSVSLRQFLAKLAIYLGEDSE